MTTPDKIASFSEVLKLDDIAKFAQILGDLGIFLGAIAAWVTFAFYSKNERDNKWLDGFRALYAEYWKDPAIFEARQWTINDGLYRDKLRPVLIARLSTGEFRNELTEEQNRILSTLDAYCAYLMRLRSFEARHKIYMRKSERSIFLRFMASNSIVERLRKRGREELIKYIEIYWFELL